MTEDKQDATGSFPFGENAHIVGEKPSGPRGQEWIADSLRNNYLNLILLCPNCHTRVDKSPEDFPVQKLHELKKSHELEMSRLYPGNKDTYDEGLSFSRVTAENWLTADRKNYVPFGVDAEQWISAFLDKALSGAVPQTIVRQFEVARGCMIYSWFFYPLATLGLEQMLRVAEFALRERCLLLGRTLPDFVAQLEELRVAAIVSSSDAARWRALGHLITDPGFHAGTVLFDPGQAIEMLRTVVELIDRLFVNVPQPVAPA